MESSNVLSTKINTEKKSTTPKSIETSPNANIINSMNPDSLAKGSPVPEKLSVSNYKNNLSVSPISPINKRLSPSKTMKKNERSNRMKIASFMKSDKTRKKLRSIYIKEKKCVDPNICIAYDAINRMKINDYFNHFVDLDYIDGNIKQIGEVSANGFVKEIKFTYDNYSAYAVLKSSVDYESDNLVYEYLAGQYINHLSNYYSCFIETYGLFYYKDDRSWEFFRDTPFVLKNEFIEGLELETTDIINYSKACQQSKRAAILLQYIHGATVLKSFVNGLRQYISYQMIYNLPYLLYQIYFALSKLKDNFTHYDLHTSNVMVYEPKRGHYIEYVYHLEDNTELRFKCPYLVKIIDYGRCFFKWGKNDIQQYHHLNSLYSFRKPSKPTEDLFTSSQDIYKRVCKEKGCEYDVVRDDGKTIPTFCGDSYGFYWLDNPERKTTHKYYISSSRSNMSHDLRLLYLVKDNLISKRAHEYNVKKRQKEEIEASEAVLSFLKKIVYGIGLAPDQRSMAGTKENKQSGLPNNRIHNVSDAEEGLRELIRDPKLLFLNNGKYNDSNKLLGTLHIYSDGTPMKFEDFQKN